MKGTTLAVTALAFSALLSGCGSKTDANEKNFSAAMTQYFDKKGEVCLGTTRWPVDVSEMEMRLAKTTKWSSFGQMTALEAVGLAKGEDVQVDIVDVFGKPTGKKVTVERFALTDAAKPFVRTATTTTLASGTTQKTDLCWGRKALNKVEKWEGPMKFGDYQAVNLLYTYKLVDVAPWASKPDVQEAFPVVKQVLAGAQSRQLQHGLHLTNQGWEAAGLDGL